jgi:hypothetical protein
MKNIIKRKASDLRVVNHTVKRIWPSAMVSDKSDFGMAWIGMEYMPGSNSELKEGE